MRAAYIGGLLVLAAVLFGISEFVSAQTDAQMRATGGTENIVSFILQLFPKLAAYGAIITAAVGWITGKITPTPGPTPTPDIAIETEIELVQAILSYVAKMDDPARLNRVVLAVIAEIRLRFSNTPAVVTAAGSLATALTQTIYVDPPQAVVNKSGY
jgi:hypothetical protein